MAVNRTVSFGPQAQSPLVQALAPRNPQQMLAIQALQEGSSTAPVQSIGEGLARVAQGALGGWAMGRERRQGEEASNRLSDAILGSMTPEQRATPQGQMLATALRDPNVGPALTAAYLQNNMSPRENWTPDPTGMFQVNSLTGERRPLDSPQRAAAMAAAGRDPIISTQMGLFSRDALMGNQGGQPQQPGGQPQATAQPGQNPNVVPPPPDLHPVLQTLWNGESGGNLNAVSPQGARGPLQFTEGTWAETLRRHPELAQQGIGPQHITDDRANALVGTAHMQDILQDGRDLIGRQVGNSTITPDALVRGAWLGGVGGMRRWVSSNGTSDPADALGTRVSQYAMGTAPNLRNGTAGISRAPLPPVGQQVAQAGQTASDAAPERPPITALIPDRNGNTAYQPQPPDVQPNLLLSQPRGSLMSGPTPTQISQAREARQNFFQNTEVKNTQRIMTVYDSMRETATRQTAASDLNMVYGLMTILDPTSVVREGEVAMVRNTQGIPSWLVGMYDRLSSGGSALSQEDRFRLLDEAHSRARAQQNTYDRYRRSEDTFLRSANLNPDAVLGERTRLPDPLPRPPPPPPPPPTDPASSSAPPRMLSADPNGATPEERARARRELEIRRQSVPIPPVPQ